MAYITDSPCEEIYMVTHKNTTKFNNLQKNPSVSLLIDSRETKPRSDAQALTIDGVFIPLIDEDKKQEILNRMMESFPNMKDFIHHPESESKEKPRLCLSSNFFCVSGVSGLIPMTAVFFPLSSSSASRTFFACVAQPEVLALGKK